MNWKQWTDVGAGLLVALIVGYSGGWNVVSMAIGAGLAYVAVQKFYPPSRGGWPQQ